MKNIALELEFEGPDAFAVSTYLGLFHEQFNEDPTNASHQLMRNLTALVEKKHGKDKSMDQGKRPASLSSNHRVIPLRRSERNGLSRSSKTPTFDDAG